MRDEAMKKKITILSILLVLVFCFTGCGAVNIVETMMGKNTPTAEDLLSKVPKIDLSNYNQFHLSMEITAGTQDGDSRKFTMSGSFETWDRISHAYNVKAQDTGTEYAKESVEGWTDYHTLETYINQGDGWAMGQTEHPEALANLEIAINSRQGAKILEMDNSACTVSWEFLTDSASLFGTFLEQDAGSEPLSGNGRITAVFDPKTYEFQYFTVVISAGDGTLSVTLLDMVLYWDTKNSTQHALVIPDTIQADAYKASTGVSSNGGYDEMVNPLAEELIEVYGGTADVTHYEDGSSLFWTLEKEGQSVTVNYTHEEDPVTRFEDSYEFLVSFYGEPAEETEDGAYFYSSDTGELAYMARGEDWYAEIIITGPAESTQGQLRKPLITYKSKLGI